jgi:hypothetical protein
MSARLYPQISWYTRLQWNHSDAALQLNSAVSSMVYSSADGERPVLIVPADGICQAGHGRAV